MCDLLLLPTERESSWPSYRSHPPLISMQLRSILTLTLVCVFYLCIILQKDRIPSVYASVYPLTSLWTWCEIVTDFFFNKSLILTSDTGNICRPKVKHETREGGSNHRHASMKVKLTGMRRDKSVNMNPPANNLVLSVVKSDKLSP